MASTARRLVLPLLLVAALVLAACGGADDDGAASDDSTAAARGGTSATNGESTCVDSSDGATDEAAQVLEIAADIQKDLGLAAVLLRVEQDGEELITAGLGETIPGVAATPEQRFWNGAAAFSYLGTVLVQLDEEGVVPLDEPIDAYLPDVPAAEQITPRMLMASTSGYVDFVPQDAWLDQLYDDPFRPFTTSELEAYVFDEPLLFEPGTNLSYSHLNFRLAGQVVEEATGRPLEDVLAERVLEPLDMADTESLDTAEIPGPALRTFTDERGDYEESSSWSPAWGVPPGAAMATTVCDLAAGARGVGSGELLSDEAFDTFLHPGTADLPGPSDDCPSCIPESDELHFGLGIINAGDWSVQTPLFTGIAGVQAYLPDQDLSIAIANTFADGSDVNVNGSTQIFEALAEQLAPDHPLPPLS